jgi:hypothetical protein
VNVRFDRQGKSTQGHGYRNVRRCNERPVTQSKVLVSYVKRESNSGGEESRSIPGFTHRCGRRPSRQRSEGDAEDKVHRTEDSRYSEPAFAIRDIHVNEY